MPQSPPRAPRSRKSVDRDRATPPRPGEPVTLRQRLRRDPFLFALCLAFLAFTTWALAVSWRLLNDPLLLVLSVLSVAPAFYLFYLRDSSAA